MTATATQPARRVVTSEDGVQIAVYQHGNPDGPTVVLAHGWPDSHVLWDGVVPMLVERFRVITYDNRGVGGSSVPRGVADYTMERFADDFGAVIDELSRDERVHVLAHDWGSVGVWEYLGRPGASTRVASFTSVSGPSSHHTANYIRDHLKRPWRPVQFLRGLGAMLRQTYMVAFAAPVLPPLLARLFLAGLLRHSLIVRDGIPAQQLHHSEAFGRDAANSIKVYRAVVRGMSKVRRDHYVDVPVQLIVNTKDRYVKPHSYDDTSRWVAQLWRRDIKAGHWAPFSHPQVLAAATTEFVEFIEGKSASRALLRAKVGRRREPFGDTLVSVTGAGSGIGRATALEFARLGAELVVSDVNEATVKETAAAIAADGGVAHVYTLDVADGDEVEAFAEQICAEHGVPDIVVNNAGIGQAGRFIDTPREEFDRVLDINLGGVVNGCRAFARRLVERGIGGHIINVASMAAYSPSQSLSAYCTSKAGVYMFSDCLRAELDAAGIGLTTICPGVIDTNIVHTTRIDAPPGKDGQVDARREQLEKFYRARRYGPEKVAKAIVSAVKKNKPIRPVTAEAYLAYGAARVAPQVLRSIARGKVL
jgi:NAD(P)-dependent dehydrogenase (short-subunit alcohol dehydrogenase family)/pimeloyl-ACP methyl ester carboxylesterase